MVSGWSTGWRGVATYALRGALVGALLGLFTALIARPAYQCSRSGLGCFPVILGAIAAAMLMGVLLGWVLLWILRVRRALLLATGGMVASLLLAAAVGAAGGGEAAGELMPMAGMGAAGYGTVAATLSVHSPAPVRVVAGAVLVFGMVFLLAQM